MPRLERFSRYNSIILLGFIALTFLFDFIDKIEIFHRIDFIKFNRILKGITIVYGLFFLLTHLKFLLRELGYFLLVLILLMLTYVFRFEYWDVYFDEFSRYLFCLMLLPLLYFETIFKNNHQFKKKFYQLLKIVMLINAVAVFSGLIFEIYVFRTYSGLGRFGYNGILLSQGETAYVYLAAAMLFWHFKDKMLLGIVIAISFLSGIKGVYFGMFLLFSLLILFDTPLKKTFKYAISASIGVAFVAVLVVLFSTPLFREVIEEEGFLTALFSYRTDNLLAIINHTSSRDYNFLLGATGLETVRVELQLADIALFFGMIGVLGFFHLFFKLYKKVVITIEAKVFFATVLFLSILSGNLLYVPISAVLFWAVLFCLYERTGAKSS